MKRNKLESLTYDRLRKSEMKELMGGEGDLETAVTEIYYYCRGCGRSFPISSVHICIPRPPVITE